MIDSSGGRGCQAELPGDGPGGCFGPIKVKGLIKHPGEAGPGDRTSQVNIGLKPQGSVVVGVLGPTHNPCKAPQRPAPSHPELPRAHSLC